MGVVYLATHEGTGRRVAIKTLLDDDPRRLERLAREICVVRTLAHPGVVAAVDHGEVDGTPWLAMELLAGRTLTRHIEAIHTDRAGTESTAETAAPQDPGWASAGPWVAAGDVSRPPGDSNLALHRARAPETSSRLARGGPRSSTTMRTAGTTVHAALEFVGQLCHTVAYLHGSGLIHGDIKPDNVFVTSGGRVVLMDFGLAAQTEGRIDPLELERLGQRAGTATYISPEQVRGGWLDARADLYAIGCILFEILSGAPPFHEENTKDIVKAHVVEVPDFDRLSAGPASLRAIVERLLSKHPAQRPAHAADIIAALHAADVEVAVDPEAPEPDTYLLRAPLTGRASVVDALLEAVGHAVAGTGSVHSLVGPAGVGKTRLALEVSREARGMGLTTLGGHCTTIGAGAEPAPALHAFRALGHRLGQLARSHRGQFDSILGDHGRVLLPYFPPLAHYVTPPAPPHRTGPTRGPIVVDALIDVLARLWGKKPLLLVMDDVQWADELSMATLSRFAAEAARRPWVLLTLSPETPPDWLPTSRPWPLGALDEAGTEAIVRGMLGTPALPAGLVTRVLRYSEGSPFQIGECLRALIDVGLLTNDLGTWSLSTSGESVENLVAGRIDRLAPDAQRVCCAAATLGTHFDEHLLRDVAALSEDRFGVALEALLRGNILGVDDDGLTFAHDRLRQATAATGVDAIELHRRAAEALGQRNGPLRRQAHHLDRSGRPEIAREYYWRAAALAVRGLAMRDAERLFRRALEVDVCADAVSVQMRCEFAERILLPLGNLEEAEAVLEGARALRGTGEPALVARIHILLGETHGRQGRRQRARRAVQEALRIAKEANDPRGEALALNALGESFRASGEIETARRLFEVARTAFAQVRDDDGLASVANNLAIVHRRLGDYPTATELYREALRHYEAGGDLAGMGRVKSNLAVIHVVRGEYEEARDLLTAALDLRRAAGDIAGEAATLDNLAELHRQQGMFEQATRLHRDALALHEQLSDRGAAAWSRKKLADLVYRNDDLEAAEAGYVEALAALGAGDSHARLMTLVALGAVQRDRGKVFDASRHLADALAGARKAGDMRAQAHALLHRARLGRYLGEVDHAETDIRAALSAFHHLEDKRGAALALCEVGHLALSCDRSASEHLERAQHIVQSLHLAVGSEPGSRVLELERAVAARSRGERLVLGQREADLPATVLEDARADHPEPKTLSVD